MSLLQVDNLSVRYGNSKVVSGVCFTVDAGEAVGLVGESGSGKSQTALAVLGLLPASARVSGSATLAGTSLLDADAQTLSSLRARRMAMVFQDPSQALNPYVTIGRQLRRILKAHRLASGAAANARVVDMLGRVGLPDPGRQFHAYPFELSGGMRQRAMIASALIAEPKLLIADEPTTALDVTVQAQILDLLESLREETALLLITHDLGIVAGRTQRMLVLESGRLVESGPTAQVFAAPAEHHTRALIDAAPRLDGAFRSGPEEAPTVLAMQDARVRYSGPRIGKLDVVRELSFELRRGEVLAVVGESGSGKSSLVRAALGLVPLASGRTVFLGQELGAQVQSRAMAVRRDLQLVFQDPVGSLNPQLRIADILAEPLLVHEPQLAAAQRRGRLSRALDDVGLDDRFLCRFAHELSGGQAQRIAIARALILAPAVLVCDEAVAALDGRVRERVLALLAANQRDRGLALLFITHDLAVARSISHRVLVMYLGRLAELAAAEQLFSRPQHPYTHALLAAVPVADPQNPGGRAALAGEMPSMASPPSGCAFHTRCRFAESVCRTTLPETRELAGGLVACHLAENLTLEPA